MQHPKLIHQYDVSGVKKYILIKLWKGNLRELTEMITYLYT